jgi:hypothetical protein
MMAKKIPKFDSIPTTSYSSMQISNTLSTYLPLKALALTPSEKSLRQFPMIIFPIRRPQTTTPVC